MNILDPILIVVRESQAEMYACWNIITFIVDSPETEKESATESALEQEESMEIWCSGMSYIVGWKIQPQFE